MNQETTGTVISVAKQWWLKINQKPIRMGAGEGAAFPHVIKVQYMVGEKTTSKENGLARDSLFLLWGAI